MSVEKRVSISYAWVNDEQNARVHRLATELEANGVNVQLDQWDLQPGQSVSMFMERLMNDKALDKVLLLLSPTYKKKADEAAGGVGQETQYARTFVMADPQQTRFIPVLFEALPKKENEPVNRKASSPHFLGDRLGIDLYNEEKWTTGIQELLNVIYGQRSNRPPRGSAPNWVQTESAPTPGRPQLIQALALLYRQFPEHLDPRNELLHGPASFSLLDTDVELKQAIHILEKGGWVTCLVLSTTNTEEGPGTRVNLQGTPLFSRLSLEPGLRTELSAILKKVIPKVTEIVRSEHIAMLDPMDNRALTNFLAEQYPTFAEARDLWKRAGGKAARVPEGPNARVRWATLIEQMEGGAIDPLRLITETLIDYPASPVLFDALAPRVPDPARTQAREVVRALRHQEAPPAPNITALTALPDATASAALAMELRALPDEEREQTKTFVQRMKEDAAQTVGTEVPKAIITMATTALTMLLKGEL